MTDTPIERLKGLLAKATKRPWVAFDRGDTLAIMKGPCPQLKPNGYPIRPWPEIIPWTGFDGSDVPKHQRRANLHLIVEVVNALPTLLATIPSPGEGERAKALEEAAKLAETHFSDPGWNPHMRTAAVSVAFAIRRLATLPSEPLRDD